MIEAFPDLPVTASDLDPIRVADLQAVHDGGVHTLTVRRLDATAMDLPDDAFDVVTMLEVLEHIPDAQRALGEAVRVARRFVVLSVPSKPDNNPEHLHLFDGPTLTATLQRAGAVRVSVDHVPDHLTVVARVGPP